MSELRRRIGMVFSRARFERELDEELRYHLELSGSPRRLGNIALIKEDSRAMWTFAFWEQLAQDARYGLRAMASNKLFTAMAVLSLALGIGANTAIFSFMDAIMLRAMPVPHPESLVVLNWRANQQPPVVHSFYGGGYKGPHGGFVSSYYPYPAFEILRANNDVLDSLFAFDSTNSANVLFRGQADLAGGQFVSGGYFSGLGVVPAAGRLIGEDDDRTGAPHVAVLSWAYWHSRFAENPNAVGMTVTINTNEYVIVGVAAPGFHGANPASEASFFLPLHARQLPDGMRFGDEHFYWLQVMGRLRPGVNPAAAQASLAGAFHRFVTSTATTDKERSDLPELLLQEGGSGVDSLRREYAEPLWVLMAMVGLILTIACANIASLLLARAAARRREIAVRLSLGAARLRIVRQMLTESLLLSLAGGAMAFVVAYPGIRLIDGLLTGGNDGLNLHVSPDWRVFGFTLALAFASGIAFGLAPAFQATRVDVVPALKGVRTAIVRRHFVGLGHALVVVQIAFSILLVTGASLFVRTLSNLESVELGFNRERLLIFSVMPGQAGYGDEDMTRLYEVLRTRFRTVPGIRAVSLSDMALVSGSMSAGGVRLPGATSVAEAHPEASFIRTGPDFLSTMGIPLLLGREIGEVDGPSGPQVAVVNEVFAKKYFGAENPLGRTIGVGKADMRIVGVAKTARYDSLKRDTPPVVYMAYRQRPHPPQQMVYELRTAGDPLALTPAVRRIVSELAPRVPIFNITTQEAQIDQTISQELTFADLCSAFAGLALTIACVGLYGLMAYAVSRRSNEIGIRMALGAQRRRIVWMVLREVLALVAAGLVIGLSGAWASASAIQSFLFGIKPADPVALIAAVGVLTSAAIAAGYAPAWRAAKVDPMAALRHE